LFLQSRIRIQKQRNYGRINTCHGRGIIGQEKKVHRKKNIAPDFPKSAWKPPTNLPSLRAAKLITVDVETKDPKLQEEGPGDIRRDGYVVGVSLAIDGWSAYLPIRHDGGDNMDEKQVIRYLKDNLKYNNPKLGANLVYDLGWLRTDGIEVNGPKYDVQIAEPLIDENKPTYRLDALALEYEGVHKDETLMTQAAQAMGIKPDKVKENLWRLPARFVGIYGEKDVLLPMAIFKKQQKRLKEQNLWELFLMETELVDLMLAMRRQGVRVDLERAHKVAKKLRHGYEAAMVKIKRAAGFTPNIWANEDMEKLCDRLHIVYPRTAPSKNYPNGQSSFQGPWLEQHEHEVLHLVREARKLDRLGSTFVQSKVIDVAVNGRVHPQLYQVRGVRGGTRTGRFSSSNPNMQQVPARDPVYAPMIRGLFLPDDGRWGKFDYSQQEPRVTVHYAFICGFRGAAEARQRYIDDPNTDYHQLVTDWINRVRETTRTVAKTINLGLSYGMGIKKLAGELNIAIQDARDLMEQYHRAVPFIRPLGDKCQRVARQRGYIKTLLGRRRRFELFGPPNWKPGIQPKRYEEAIEEFGRPVNRYFLHKAMNALIQGGAADMIKKAMINVFREGIVPHLTVHDELDCTIHNKKEAKLIRDIMLNCVKLTVPLKVDVGIGPSWGETKDVGL
jgi:DNA polymerase I-like protein with 3'-5' exonuclease and polymerase domains